MASARISFSLKSLNFFSIRSFSALPGSAGAVHPAIFASWPRLG
jgi:hypothetical protein